VEASELTVYLWEGRKNRREVAHLFEDGADIPWSVRVDFVIAAPSLKAVAEKMGYSAKLMAQSYDVRILQEIKPKDKVLGNLARKNANKVMWRLAKADPSGKWEIDG